MIRALVTVLAIWKNVCFRERNFRKNLLTYSLYEKIKKDTLGILTKRRGCERAETWQFIWKTVLLTELIIFGLELRDGRKIYYRAGSANQSNVYVDAW